MASNNNSINNHRWNRFWMRRTQFHFSLILFRVWILDGIKFFVFAFCSPPPCLLSSHLHRICCLISYHTHMWNYIPYGTHIIWFQFLNIHIRTRTTRLAGIWIENSICPNLATKSHRIMRWKVLKCQCTRAIIHSSMHLTRSKLRMKKPKNFMIVRFIYLNEEKNETFEKLLSWILKSSSSSSS